MANAVAVQHGVERHLLVGTQCALGADKAQLIGARETPRTDGGSDRVDVIDAVLQHRPLHLWALLLRAVDGHLAEDRSCHGVSDGVELALEPVGDPQAERTRGGGKLR